MQSVRWGLEFAENVNAVGGAPAAVLRAFSEESITTMMRNGLSVKANGRGL